VVWTLPGAGMPAISASPNQPVMRGQHSSCVGLAFPMALLSHFHFESSGPASRPAGPPNRISFTTYGARKTEWPCDLPVLMSIPLAEPGQALALLGRSVSGAFLPLPCPLPLPLPPSLPPSCFYSIKIIKCFLYAHHHNGH
jgi:hypothetical protein